MSACIYYRRGFCVNPERCQYKAKDDKKHDTCGKLGELSDTFDKSSAGPRAGVERLNNGN